MNDVPDPTPASPSLMKRHRAFLAPLWLLALGGVLVLAAAVIYWNSATTTTVVLLRHAEKQAGAIDDAPLTPQGEQRAARLAQMFGDADRFGRVQRIYVTDTRRTQQTAAGLAQRLDLEPVVVEAKSSISDLAHRVLRENRGGVALVVGHSNTVPELVAELADTDRVPPIGDQEFDTLYVVTVPTIGRPSVLRMKY
ncbi:MAG TPA: phosphoglycerate mutase family protein [Steroidobacteraceae bacterium]|nr:phosphoglycerate mutase family protein [Steroidobacteraceae bacterium]